MQLKPEAGKTEANLIVRARAQRLCIGKIHNLGTAGIFTAKPRQQRIGNVLVVLIEEVVGGKKSQARIEVDTSTGLIIREPLRQTVRSEVCVVAIGGIRRWNVSQEILRG